MFIRKRAVLFSFLLFAVLLSSGCLWEKTPSDTQSPPPAVFVDYHRTGGVVGFDDRLVVFDNGAGIVASRTKNIEITLNQTEMDQIAALIDASRFSQLQGNYTSRRGGADLIQYSISYRGKTVKTEDSAIPPALQPVIDELDRIVSQSGKSDHIFGISRIQT